jgi:hypothetical protein
LYAAVEDATAMAEACLELNSLESLSLAADVADEGMRLREAVRETLDTRLEKNLESEDADMARLAAEVRLHRRLKKSFHVIDDRRAMDTSLISCAEYQLFIDFKRAGASYHQPDHWTTSRFIEGKSKEPIAGIRFEDAIEFCQWLSRSRGEKYRLPKENEVRHFHEGNNRLPGFWLSNRRIAGLSPDKELWIREKLAQDTYSPIARFLTLDHDLALDLDLSRARAFARSIDRVFSYSSDLGHGLTFDLDLDLDLSRARAIKLALGLARARVRAFARKIPRTLDEKEKFSVISQEVERSNFSQAKKMMSTINVEDVTTDSRHFFSLLSTALNLAVAETYTDWRAASHAYVLLILELICETVSIEKSFYPRGYWGKWLKAETVPKGYQKDIIDLYWFLRTVQLREQGELPAWEGILLVREKS